MGKRGAPSPESIPKSIRRISPIFEDIKKCAAFLMFLYIILPSLTADTIVAIDGKILGKPADEKDAFAMLKTLSGRVHEVFTGVCVIFANGQKERFFEETKVEFYELSDEEIAEYLACGEYKDKAGAYGIQGKGGLLCKKIDGDYFNIVGFPAAEISRRLKARKKSM